MRPHATITVQLVIIIRPHRLCVAYRCALLLAMLMVCLSDVRLLVTRMNCGKTAGPIEMPFGMWGGVGDSHHVLDGGQDPPHGNRQFWGGEGAVP